MTRRYFDAWTGAAVIAAGVLLASCANRPESIHASYVSHEKYMHLDCSGLSSRMFQTRAELERNSQVQNEKADGDAVGVFLFGVPFSKLSGDVEGEIARLKGEIEAIDTARIKQKCGTGTPTQITASARKHDTAASADRPSASAPQANLSPRPARAAPPAGVPATPTPTQARAGPPQWVAINDPGELRAIYSDTTIRGTAYGRDPRRAVPFVGQYRSDGTGILILRGQRIPRLWSVRGSDQVCATDADGTNCYRLERNVNNPNEIKGRHVSSGVTTHFTVESDAATDTPRSVEAAVAAADSAPSAASPVEASTRTPSPRGAPAAEANAPPPAAAQPVASAAETLPPAAPSDDRILPTGTTWIYQTSDNMYGRGKTTLTVRVIRSNLKSVEESLSAVCEAIRTPEVRRVVGLNAREFLEFPVGTCAVLVEFAPYLLAAEDAGDPAWNALSAVGYPRGSQPPWDTQVKVHGWTEVVVPAGSYRALRVEINGKRNATGNEHGTAGRFRVYAWYAPEVKRLVRIEHRVWSGSFSTKGQQLGDEVTELLAYRPPS